MNKEIKKIISNNSAALKNSSCDFEAIYNIIFSQAGVCAEYTDGFRIYEVSFSDMKEKIEKASGALFEKIGATGGYVALAMENSVDFVILFWAILRSGNKPYLVNLRHPKHLTETILKNLDIHYIISDCEKDFSGEYILSSSLYEYSSNFKGEFENEIAISTSATSLKDVVCFYTGAELSSQILNAENFLFKYPEITKGYKGRIKLLAFLPFYHVFGLIAVYFWFSFFGQTIVFLSNYSSDTILKTCKKHNVTHIFAVPLLWHTIEKEVLKKVRQKGDKKEKQFNSACRFCTAVQNIFPHAGMYFSQKLLKEVTDELFGQSVRFCISGGSYIRQSALEMFNAIGYNLHNGYGMSEIGITSVELRPRPKHKNLNSIGRPFNSVKYMIDPSGNLLVKGSSICKRLMIEGKEVPMGEWFPTGDKMEQRDNDYYILGREGDIIIGENGENINPDVVEKAFFLPEAENFSVLGLDGVLSMVVQVSEFISQAKKKAVIDKVYSVNNSLPLTSRVQKFYFTKDIISPPTAVKVGRKYLKNAIASSQVTLTPFSESEEILSDSTSYSEELLLAVKEIVAEVLDTDSASLDINANVMLDLGASSMQYFTILTRLAEKFSISGNNESEYRYTIHEFCQYIERQL